jgi:hypothetical protein
MNARNLRILDFFATNPTVPCLDQSTVLSLRRANSPHPLDEQDLFRGGSKGPCEGI